MKLIQRLEKKGYNRTLSLFKEWYEETNKNKTRVYKWNTFIREWDEPLQIDMIRDFIYDKFNIYITAKKHASNNFRPILDNKLLPRTFKLPSEAHLYVIEKILLQEEKALITEERKDPEFDKKEIQKKFDLEEKKKKILDEKKKIIKEQKAERISQSVERRRSREIGE